MAPVPIYQKPKFPPVYRKMLISVVLSVVSMILGLLLWHFIL